MKLISALFLIFLLFQNEKSNSMPIDARRDITIEFKTAALSALINLCINNKYNFHYYCTRPLDLNLIRYVVTDTPLFIKVDGVLQDCTAQNEPASNTIYIHRSRWQAISDIHDKEAIALHEVLSLENIEGTGNYFSSSAYGSFWKSQVLETAEDIKINRSIKSRTVVSDYNKYKAFFFAAGYGLQMERFYNFADFRCWASIASPDPRVADKVFRINIQSSSRPSYKSNGGQEPYLQYFTTEALPLQIGNTSSADAGSSSLAVSRRDFFDNDIEISQTFVRGERTEILKVRALDAIATAYKLEVYEQERLVINLFGACQTDLCQNYFFSYYPSPACPNPARPF